MMKIYGTKKQLAKRWREKAKGFRERAESSSNKWRDRAMREVANAYEFCAEELEMLKERKP